MATEAAHCRVEEPANASWSRRIPRLAPTSRNAASDSRARARSEATGAQPSVRTLSAIR